MIAHRVGLFVILSVGGCHACDSKATDDAARATTQHGQKDVAGDTDAEDDAARAVVGALEDATTECDRLRDREGSNAEGDLSQSESLAPRFACDRATQSGWAVRYDPNVDAGRATFTAVHVGTSSPRWSAPSTDAQYVLWPPSLEVHDFDGDGDPELFTTLEYGAGASEWVVARLFVTYKNGRVTPYAPATGLPVARFEDVDKDGRPDLVLEYEVGHGHRCDVEGSVPQIVTLIAHTRADGTFSLSDAVARSELAKRFKCTGLPAHVVTLPADIDAGDTISEKPIVCARLWGAKKDDVLAEIESVCAPWAAQTNTCHGPCRYIEDMQKLAQFDPPVTLTGEP